MAAQPAGSALHAQTAELVQPLFRLALLKGSTSSVILHIRRGAPVNGRDSRGLTPLMLAAAAGRDDICSLLMDEGADNSLTGPDDRTASDLAGAAGYSNLALKLAPKPASSAPSALSAAGNLNGEFSGEDKLAPGWSDDGWEVEEVFQLAAPDPAIRPAILDVQTSLSAARAYNADPDWREVQIDLPVIRQASGSNDLDLLREISRALAYERLPVRRYRRLVKAIGGITQLLEDLGIQIDTTAFDGYITAQIGPCKPSVDDRSVLREVEQALAALQASQTAEELFAAEVARIPYVDRSAEQSMFRGFDLSRRALFRQIADSVKLVPEFLGADVNTGGPPDDEKETQDTDFESSATGEEDELRASPQSAAEATARPLYDTLVSLVASGSSPRDEIFDGIDVDLEFADQLEYALRGNGHLADAEQLASAIRRYLRDRNRIAEANLPLVLKTAPRYAHGNVAEGDLVQEASIGLLRAIERFDASRSNRFGTYAVWWICQACSRFVEDFDRTIRLPVYFIENLKRVEAISLKLSHQLGRRPLNSELAETAGFRLDLVQRLEQLAVPVASIEDPNFFAAASLLVDGAQSAFEATHSDQCRSMIAEAVNTLEPRDAEVVRRRFGLDTGDDETLEEIGRDFGLTRERIRQLEARALKKLSRPGTPYGRQLRALL